MNVAGSSCWKSAGILVLLLQLILVGRAHSDDDLRIISQPVTVAEVGEIYTYDVDAVSSSGPAVVVYELREAPTRMTIDDTTGLIQWIPSEPGLFRIKIRAQSLEASPSSGGHADQEYMLWVSDGEPSRLQGIVHSETGTGIGRVRLRLFETSSPHRMVTTFSDSSGEYRFIPLQAGTYIMRIQPEGNEFADQWYDRVLRVEDATPIVIPESSTVTLNIPLLPRNSLPQRFLLSGTVRDTIGVPLSNVRVFIFRARQQEDRDSSGFNFEGLDDFDRDQRLETSVLTDALGRFAVQLRSRQYILLASRTGYLKQFWNHQENILTANRLRLVRDTTGIDFDLTPLELSTAGITGRITAAGSTVPVPAHIIAFHKSNPSGRFSGFVRIAETDSAGTYELHDLRGGFYVILAVPQGNFLPAYYDTSGGTPFLSRAFPVPVSHNIVTGINIRVHPDTLQGMHRVRGIVRSGVLPVTGTLLAAVSLEDGGVHGTAFSESQGCFSIVGLAPGVYNIVAMNSAFSTVTSSPFALVQRGFLPVTMNVSVDMSGGIAEVNTDDASTPRTFALSQNYPNPFNPSMTVRFSLAKKGVATIKVYDVLGREVATMLHEEKEAGSHSVVWNAVANGKAVASGVYIYRLTTAQQSIARKMLLTR